MSTEKDFPKLSLDEILNGRKTAEKSIPIYMRLDVMADIEELERQITGLQGDTDDGRLAGSGDDPADLADRIRELEAIGRQYTINLRVRALDKKLWKQKVDEFTEENEDGVAKLDLAALVTDIFPDSLVSPEMGPSQRDSFLTGLSDGQWESVMQGVFDVNRRTVTVGKSLTASFVTRPKNKGRGPDAK